MTNYQHKVSLNYVEDDPVQLLIPKYNKKSNLFIIFELECSGEYVI